MRSGSSTLAESVRSRVAIQARLEARRGEIEEAALARVRSIADPLEVADPQYVEGLKLSVSAAVDYALAAVASGAEDAPTVPPTLLGQARLAARIAVPLDTVLRRYFAGYTLFGDFLLQEAEGSFERRELKGLLHAQAALFDHLVVSVTEEYERERQSRPRSSEERRLKQVQRLLDGELQDSACLDYRVDAWHTGVVALGADAQPTLRRLATVLGRELLIVCPEEGAAWAWLGGSPLQSTDVAEHDVIEDSRNLTIACGEPAAGLRGWRLTHRQARAALLVAKRGTERVLRYADVALTAAALQDHLLAVSLRQIYLNPLDGERDGGQMARETLRAYFKANRNISASATATRVNRNTLAGRLRAIETLLGCPLDSCAASLEIALRLDELGD